MLKTVGFLTLSLRAILGAAAAFTDVTLVDHDGRPPAAPRDYPKYGQTLIQKTF